MGKGVLIAAGLAAALPVAAKAQDAAPVYSTDRRDPWNRLFHLLYARKLRAQVVSPENSRGPWRTITRLEGGDLPEFFFPPDAGYLLEEPRRSRLRSALEAEVSSPTLRGRTAEGRILFQQDLWNRFDALHALAAKDRHAMQLARLLARLMAKVALTMDEIKGMRISFAEAAQERVDPRLFEADSPWRELVSYFELGPHPEGGTTLHARRAGWRLVFRRFVRIPPEAGGEKRGKGLPSGTIALLLETPLAVSAEGELHPVPLLLAAQVRVVQPGGDFNFLHAPRLAISASPRRLRLEAFGQHDLVPQLGGAFPRTDGHPLVPVRQSCVLCHGRDGGTLGTDSMQLRPRTEMLAPVNTVEEERVLRAKRHSESFRALLRFFRGD